MKFSIVLRIGQAGALSKDEFAMYVEQGKPAEKPKYRFTGDGKEALKDYYDAVHTLCKAQTNFMASTKVLEEKLRINLCS